MAYEGNAATQSMTGEITRDNTALQIFYFSLSLIIVGVGFLKQTSVISRELYETGDKRRDSGFTLFLHGNQLRFILATLICVWLGENTAGVMVLVQLSRNVFLIIDFYFRKEIINKENRLRFRDKIIGLKNEWLIYAEVFCLHCFGKWFKITMQFHGL
jgi:POT family proton-dependent oligopeptide transporter